MPLIGQKLRSTPGEKRRRESHEGAEEIPSRLPSTKSSSPSSAAKKARTIGPTLPPGLPPQDSDVETSDEEDEFGPSLPAPPSQVIPGDHETTPIITPIAAPPSPSETKHQRDEWMVIPPAGSDWSSRMDPTKLRNRKFNAGRGAKEPGPTSSKEDNTTWTETPEEKRARLQREVMGINDTSTGQLLPEANAGARDNARKLRECGEKARGPTLYQKHQKSNVQDKEDDPSARAFDREKDIAGGFKISHTQRREMMTKAADFGSKFSHGKFL